jgi:hypothetical protein
MIDERFSAAAFEALRGDRAATRELADLLQAEVLDEIEKSLKPLLETIVARLNGLGHSLRPYGEAQPGDIAYRDDETDDLGYDCKLRLCFDITISAGYADVRFSRSNPNPPPNPYPP